MGCKPALLLSILVAAAPLGGGVPDDDLPSFYKLRKELAVRKGGVKLDTMVEVRTIKGTEEVAVHWVLDYNGPRKPLIILEPSLERRTQGQTVLSFHASGLDKKRYEIGFAAPGKFKQRSAPKEWFITVLDKPATGAVVVPVREIHKEFAEKWPKYDWREKPPPIHVQLEHLPEDRGEKYELDAWTGELVGPMMSLKLEKW